MHLSRSALALFFLSGAAGLIYEVLWVRMLIRAFGVTTYAVSTVLAVYMLGLALGSVLSERYRGRFTATPLTVWAWLECLVGVSGLVSTAAIIQLPAAYTFMAHALGSGPVAAAGIRLGLSALVLLPTTALMGATLPVLNAAFMGGEDEDNRVTAQLYGANTLGAVFGVLWSGFVLLETVGEWRTALFAVFSNIFVAVLGLRLARPASANPPPVTPAPSTTPPDHARVVLAVYVVAGFCALSWQVVWSRLLNLLLGNSVYAFSMMLAVYLGGVALGSLAFARWSGLVRAPLAWLGSLQAGSGILALLSLWVFTQLGAGTGTPESTYSMLHQDGALLRMLLCAVAIVFPVTFFSGAMFPLANRLAGGAVGSVYAANTFGAIIGSLLTGFVLVPHLGTKNTFVLAAGVSLLAGFYLLLAQSRAWRVRVAMAVLVGAFLVALQLAGKDPFLAVLQANVPTNATLVAHSEDHHGTVTFYKMDHGHQLYINGISTSGTSPMMGSLLVDVPMLFHENPRSSLIVGLGVGEAFRASMALGMDTTVAELQPKVLEAFRNHAPQGQQLASDPRAHVVFNDGRNHLVSTDGRFDLVVVDVTPPLFASGMVNLYAAEFQQLVRAHLTDRGVFVLWAPLPSFETDVWMLARTFCDTFPTVLFWTLPGVPGILIWGTSVRAQDFLNVSAEQIQQRINQRSAHPQMDDARQVLAGIVLPPQGVCAVAAAYPAVTDDRPETEFPLGRFLAGEKYQLDSVFLFERREELLRTQPASRPQP